MWPSSKGWLWCCTCRDKAGRAPSVRVTPSHARRRRAHARPHPPPPPSPHLGVHLEPPVVPAPGSAAGTRWPPLQHQPPRYGHTRIGRRCSPPPSHRRVRPGAPPPSPLASLPSDPMNRTFSWYVSSSAIAGNSIFNSKSTNMEIHNSCFDFTDFSIIFKRSCLWSLKGRTNNICSEGDAACGGEGARAHARRHRIAAPKQSHGPRPGPPLGTGPTRTDPDPDVAHDSDRPYDPGACAAAAGAAPDQALRAGPPLGAPLHVRHRAALAGPNHPPIRVIRAVRVSRSIRVLAVQPGPTGRGPPTPLSKSASESIRRTAPGIDPRSVGRPDSPGPGRQFRRASVRGPPGHGPPGHGLPGCHGGRDCIAGRRTSGGRRSRIGGRCASANRARIGARKRTAKDPRAIAPPRYCAAPFARLRSMNLQFMCHLVAMLNSNSSCGLAR